MKVGLIDVDGHKYPNLALMKISAYHKAQGDDVEWAIGFGIYDIVYQSKVFDETYSADIDFMPIASEIRKGGTGYFRTIKIGKVVHNEIYHNGQWCNIGLNETYRVGNEMYSKTLSDEIEHIYPDYSIYPQYTEKTCFGFMTRGCPRNCGFCIVGAKEGLRSFKVANLNEFRRDQKYVELLDPNLLACRQHKELLQQLVESKSYVNFNQGLDIRMTTPENIELINKIKVKEIHFAWDNANDDLKQRFINYTEIAKHKPHGKFGTVYCLTNFGSTMEENLYRIYTLRDIGYDPYVMIYDKPNAPKEIRNLQRWCNNRRIFRTCERFEDYNG